jgi:hypothetical protein
MRQQKDFSAIKPVQVTLVVHVGHCAVAQGIEPLVIGWGAGFAAHTSAAALNTSADDETDIDWNKANKYFARQWVPGSKERAKLVGVAF